MSTKKSKPAVKVPFTIAPGLRPLATAINKLKPDPNNANDHSAESITAIKKSLQRFGQLKAIVVTADGIIRAGNGTWLAAKELGATQIAAVTIPKELEDKAEEFALADNQAGRLSAWNPGRLKKAIERIAATGTTPAELGFEEKQLAAIVSRAVAKKDVRDAWASAGPAKPRSKPGDLWILGKHRLLVGDSRDAKAIRRLMGGRKAQLVFTDPPYGVDYEDAKGRKIKNDALGRDTLSGFLTAAFKTAVEAAASDAAFYIWHASATRADFEHALKAAGLEERQYLIWAKPSLVLGHADYQWNHEPCFYASKAGTRPAFFAARSETTLWRFEVKDGDATAAALGPGLFLSDGKGNEITVTKGLAAKKLRHLRVEPGKPLRLTADEAQGTVWEISRDTQQTVHPNQKPVELALRAMENSTQAGQAVLDIFGGSGGTLLAAEMTGRDAFLVELDPKYADAILTRWERATKLQAKRQ